jgi:hypothetical protein
MVETEEGFNFKSAFKGAFGSIEGAQERLKAERRAGLTPKQRERTRKAIPKKQVNFRAREETHVLIQALAEHLDVSITDVMERAVHALAETLPELRSKK